MFDTIWSAVAERSGDTAFRTSASLQKRRGATLPAAVQKLWSGEIRVSPLSVFIRVHPWLKEKLRGSLRSQRLCVEGVSVWLRLGVKNLFRHRHFGGWLAGFRQRRGFPTLVEFHADDLADAAFLHRHAVKHVGHADGAFVVSDDDEL
jgi:hypothetical protein